MIEPIKIGIRVRCVLCKRTKAPRGRSIPMAIIEAYCTSERCIGYDAEPRVGDLWPDETDADFGYPCSDWGTAKFVRIAGVEGGE